jgi:hypothetical protein
MELMIRNPLGPRDRGSDAEIEKDFVQVMLLIGSKMREP